MVLEFLVHHLARQADIEAGRRQTLMAEGLADDVEFGACLTWCVAKVWRKAWVEVPAMPASLRYLWTRLRMARLPRGRWNFVRKNAASPPG
jgi:hypothetical protein